MQGPCRISFESECHGEMSLEEFPVDLQIAMRRSISPVFAVKCSDPLSYISNLLEVDACKIKELCVKIEHRVFVLGALTYASEELCEKLISLVLLRYLGSRVEGWKSRHPELYAALKSYDVWISKTKKIRGWRYFYKRDREKKYSQYPSKLFETWASKCLRDFYELSDNLGPLVREIPPKQYAHVLQLIF